MKTNQILERPMGNFKVLQRTSDGYFDGNALLRQWNNTPGNEQRKMDEFLESKRTIEFIDALIEEERENGLGENSPKIDNQAFKKSKVKTEGRAGRPQLQVWMHPMLFIKFAMWINPRFEVKVIRFVYDQLIQYRNDAGDAYREMNSALKTIVHPNLLQAAIKNVARALNYVVYGAHETGMRNKVGEELKARELLELERDIAKSIKRGFIKTYDECMNFLRREYYERNKLPKELMA